MKHSGLLLLACLLVTGCSKSEENKKADPRKPDTASQQTATVATPALQPSPQQPSQPPQSGKVVEVKQAGVHTYVKIEADGAHHWLATNPAKPRPGEVVHWDRFSVKQNYYSKALNQTFPTILFVGTLQPGPSPVVVAPSKGKAHAVLNAGGYTYVQIGNATGLWLAGPTARVKEGDTLIWAQGTPMKNFTNKTLNRTFDEIVFLGRLQVETPSGTPQTGTPPSGTTPPPPGATPPEAVQPPVKPQRPLQRATPARETPAAVQPPQAPRRNVEAGAPKTPPPPVRQPPHKPEPPKPPAR
ncbi:MAG: hypothetical protein HQL98_08185 [Magnetococcales bacterium]|nr:hypothetical protein [Magnetococcales bacterium]